MHKYHHPNEHETPACALITLSEARQREVEQQCCSSSLVFLIPLLVISVSFRNICIYGTIIFSTIIMLDSKDTIIVSCWSHRWVVTMVGSSLRDLGLGSGFPKCLGTWQINMVSSLGTQPLVSQLLKQIPNVHFGLQKC